MTTWLRSLLGWVSWVVLTLTLGPAVGLTALAGRRASFRVSRTWARLMLRAAGISVEVIGGENADPDRPAVYVSNHHSYVDVLSIIAYFPVDLLFVAKKTLLVLPGLNVAMWLQGHILVPRGRPTAALRLIRRRGTELLGEVAGILIFPTGERGWDASVGEFKSGAAALALWAGVPIVPLAIAGSRDVLPRGNWPMKPGNVIIRIGKQIPTEGKTIKQRDALTAEAREKVAALKQAADTMVAELEKTSDNHSIDRLDV